MASRKLNKRHRILLRWGAPCVGLALLLACALIVRLVGRPDPAAANADGAVPGITSVHSRNVSSEMVQFAFESRAREAGIEFRHFPAVRQSLLPEDMGSGLAWGDFDDDGDVDLFLVNFHRAILDPIQPNAQQGRCALYRNEGDGRFTDVSQQAGVDLLCFGMACAWGDYDNDDDLDLYVTCFGPNHLFRNEGDGSFTDVTDEADVGDPRFSAGCAWSDYDVDGDLDLYVCTYVDFKYHPQDRDRSFDFQNSETPHTINPSSYPPDANLLYRNNGDGTFTDVAAQAGVANEYGRSMGASWFDFDQDGLVDLYVANDVSSNGVYLNKGDGAFADIGASSLAADYRGAMGLAVGDYDHDADLDLFVTHWLAQENAFFANLASTGWMDDAGQPMIAFADEAYHIGLGHSSLDMVGWATGFADFDNDGQSDLWVVNGNTLQRADDPTQLKPQRMQLFRQRPPDGFYDIAQQACPDLADPLVGRGGAHADYDGDGKIDLAVIVHGAEAMLLRNTTPSVGNWFGLRLRQRGGNTRALGALVNVRAGEISQTAQVGSDASYLSQCELDLHFGIGSAETIEQLTIQWPDGGVDRYRDILPNQILTYVHEAEYSQLDMAGDRSATTE